MSSNDRKIQTASLIALSGLLSIVVFLSSANSAFAQSYTTPGVYTYTVGDYTQLDVQIAGGGGGGGGWAGGYNYWAALPCNYNYDCVYPGAGGGAGASGGYTSFFLTVSPGQRFTFYVGGGGTGGVFSYNGFSGGGGGSSYFDGYLAGGGGGGGGAVGCDGDNNGCSWFAGGGGGGGGGTGAGENAPGGFGSNGGYGYGSGGTGANIWWWPVLESSGMGPSSPVRGGLGSSYGGNGGGSGTVMRVLDHYIIEESVGEYPREVPIYTMAYTSGSPGSSGSANGGSVVPGGGAGGGAGSSGIYGNGGSGGNGYVVITPQNPVSAGVCGTANDKTYAYGSSSYSPYTQCSSGSPSTTSFPSAGSSVSWTCSGTNSGAAASCSASQSVATTISAPTPWITATPSSIVYGETSLLQWGQSGTAATSCTTSENWYNGASCNQTASGNVGPLTSSQTYTFYSTNAGGTGQASVDVTVAPPGSCAATTISNCSLPTTASGSSAGSCDTGYNGPCRYTCTDGVWSQNLNSCTAASYSCTGTVSANATMYAGDNTGLTANTVYAYSVSNTAAKCEYTCNSGYTRSGSSCVALSDLSDLTAGAVSPVSATADTAQTFSTTISNNGLGSSGTAFNNFMQVATAINGGGTITDISSVNMPTLTGGGTNTFSKSYTFASAGTFSLRVCADKSSSGNAGTITESNEGNNCGAWTTVTVTVSSSCVVNQGSACTSAPNSCGETNSGTIQCNGSCSASPPLNAGCPPPSNCSGITIGTCDLPASFSGNSSGSCHSGYSGSCNYSCNNGTWSMNSNSCIAPLPTATISANPTRVKAGDPSTIFWNATDVASCVITGPGYSSGTVLGPNISGSHTIATVNTQTIYTITCVSLPPKSVTVNILASFQEF